MADKDAGHEALERLGSEARSVLAVLVLAALWPERFPGGWVSVTEFGRCGLYLGERADRESLKAAIRRGLRRLLDSGKCPLVEYRRTTKHDNNAGRLAREYDRRMMALGNGNWAAWLSRHGSDLVAPETWRSFASARVHSEEHLWDSLRSLEDQLRTTVSAIERAEHIILRRTPQACALRRLRRATLVTIAVLQEAGTPSLGGSSPR